MGFAETDLCRRVPLLNYFGETYSAPTIAGCATTAGRQEKELADITIPAQMFLSCVKRTGEIFGAGHIVEVLRGSRSQKVLKFGHEKLSTYGIGKRLFGQTMATPLPAVDPEGTDRPGTGTRQPETHPESLGGAAGERAGSGKAGRREG